ncbi:MAG: DUF1232 domain-containing protein [Chitinophagaceae bacterium]|nr:DUF1232 domain-containing protein [Chitinophagaceae bacterium]
MMRKRPVSGSRPGKRYLLTLYYSFRDPRTPWYAQLTTLAAIAYLLSPVDLVPDVIPVAGYLDDLIVVPLLLQLASRMLPSMVLQAAQQKAAANSKRLKGLFLILLALALIGVIILVHHLYSR